MYAREDSRRPAQRPRGRPGDPQEILGLRPPTGEAALRLLGCGLDGGSVDRRAIWPKGVGPSLDRNRVLSYLGRAGRTWPARTDHTAITGPTTCVGWASACERSGGARAHQEALAEALDLSVAYVSPHRARQA